MTDNQVFNIDYCRKDSRRRIRHGLTWSADELEALRRCFDCGSDLETMCDALERPAEGIVAKLRQIGAIRMGDLGLYVRVTPKIKVKEGNIMIDITKTSVSNYEVKTMIQGREAAGMSDADIFRAIAKLEKEQDALEAVRNKPKKLLAAIESLRAEIQSIVAYVDNR